MICSIRDLIEAPHDAVLDLGRHAAAHLRQLLPEAVDDVADHLAHVHPGENERQLAALDARDVQQVLDQAGQPHHLSLRRHQRPRDVVGPQRWRRSPRAIFCCASWS